jgi:DUF438 domain-containing protein
MSRTWNQLLLDDHQTADKVFDAMTNAFVTTAGPSAAAVGMMLDFFRNYVDRVHNRKEEDHLFPLIESRGVPRHGGPLAVRLMEHEQGRQILARLVPGAEAVAGGDRSRMAELKAVFSEYATLLCNHFWKENDILYPMALRVMTPEDGAAVVAGIEALEAVAGAGVRARYYALAAEIVRLTGLDDLSLDLDRGVLASILNTLPVELSFVDAEDTVRYFSHEDQDKIFPRTRSAIGMKVQDCHPPTSLHMVQAILADFKAGRRDVAEFWIDFDARKVHIRYFAVRGREGRYLGCLEVVQDITAIQALQGQKRLLDA